MVTPTNDNRSISKILNHPKVFKYISDDCTQFPVNIDDNALYLINDSETGVIRLDQLNGVTCLVHIAMIPGNRESGIQFVKNVINWAIENTMYLKAIAIIPEFNKLAIELVKKCGFAKEGKIKKSFLKNMKLHDQILFGLTKTDFLEGE